jgi:hypothetical protein
MSFFASSVQKYLRGVWGADSPQICYAGCGGQTAPLMISLYEN